MAAENALGSAERTHKVQTAPCPAAGYLSQGTCPAEKMDHWGTLNPRRPEMRLSVGSTVHGANLKNQEKKKEYY